MGKIPTILPGAGQMLDGNPGQWALVFGDLMYKLLLLTGNISRWSQTPGSYFGKLNEMWAKEKVWYRGKNGGHSASVVVDKYEKAYSVSNISIAIGYKRLKFSPILSKIVSVLLSASVERFFVSRMRDLKKKHKSCNLFKFELVLLSALVERVGVSRMQDFLYRHFSVRMPNQDWSMFT